MVYNFVRRIGKIAPQGHSGVRYGDDNAQFCGLS
ncbi:unnamed protein product [Acanthoscelides obtectus]|uniref:Uncharacterized protein n=1 Tax=Acanthoscelides obtectus TaxID=200917 RepID=A0A9P0LBU2_ACAOB|nr:unnamed protein product [Acanthoscelides obtectus]CAK1676407.1 hypothetical protein AOBTE_LOCUS30737 [Acanthoscelides obtectus]